MKKKSILILGISLVIMAAGCGKGEINEVKDVEKGDFYEEDDVEVDADIELDSEDESDDEELWSADDLLQFGTVDGDVYENVTLGYGCKLEGWSYADEAKIAEMNNLGKDALPEDMQDMIEDTGNVFDMFAESADGMQNINVQFQDIGLLYGALLDAEQIVDLTVEQMPDLLVSAGYDESTVCEKTTVILDGTEYAGISVEGINMMGIQLYQKMVCIERGEYLVYITATSFLEDSVDEIYANFYSL